MALRRNSRCSSSRISPPVRMCRRIDRAGGRNMVRQRTAGPRAPGLVVDSRRVPARRDRRRALLRRWPGQLGTDQSVRSSWAPPRCTCSRSVASSSSLDVPTRWYEAGLVAFEISRRHRFATLHDQLPDGVTVHLLPSGHMLEPDDRRQLKWSDFDATRRIDRQRTPGHERAISTPSSGEQASSAMDFDERRSHRRRSGGADPTPAGDPDHRHRGGDRDRAVRRSSAVRRFREGHRRRARTSVSLAPRAR